MIAKADCSFVNAGKGQFGVGHGGPPVDLGGALVAQAVDFGAHACSVSESLIVTDCAAHELIILEGGQPSENALSHHNSVKALQPPQGPIALRKLGSIKAIEKVSQLNGVEFTQDFSSWLVSRKQLRKFDPYCGCKLYYPDSAGAKS